MAMKWAIAIMADRPNLLRYRGLRHLCRDARRRAFLDLRLIVVDHDGGCTVRRHPENLRATDRQLGNREVAVLLRLLARDEELHFITRPHVRLRDVEHDEALDAGQH